MLFLLHCKLRRMSQTAPARLQQLQRQYDKSVQTAMKEMDGLEGDLRDLVFKHSDRLGDYRKWVHQDRVFREQFASGRVRSGTNAWRIACGAISQAQAGMTREFAHLEELGEELRERFCSDDLQKLWRATVGAAAFDRAELPLVRPANFAELQARPAYDSLKWEYLDAIETRAATINPRLSQMTGRNRPQNRHGSRVQPF